MYFLFLPWKEKQQQQHSVYCPKRGLTTEANVLQCVSGKTISSAAPPPSSLPILGDWCPPRENVLFSKELVNGYVYRDWCETCNAIIDMK